jgi:hypothetical protein
VRVAVDVDHSIKAEGWWKNEALYITTFLKIKLFLANILCEPKLISRGDGAKFTTCLAAGGRGGTYVLFCAAARILLLA